jgi:hypothetical protein
LVDRVMDNPRQVHEALGPQSYRAPSGRMAVLPPARPAGEGVYALARHGDHVHLAHVLEHPRRGGPVQRELWIEDQASFILNVRNPEFIERPEYPDYPPGLRALFQERKFLAADPPAFLDYEHTELLFIAVRRAVDRELGISIQRDDEARRSMEIVQELKIRRLDAPIGPLFEGEWA